VVVMTTSCLPVAVAVSDYRCLGDTRGIAKKAGMILIADGNSFSAFVFIFVIIA